MLQITFFHVCENAIVDSQSGNIYIINAFDNINASKFPAVQTQMAVVAGFKSDKSGSYEVELLFLDEKNEIMKIKNNISIGSN